MNERSLRRAKVARTMAVLAFGLGSGLGALAQQNSPADPFVKDAVVGNTVNFVYFPV